MRVTNLKNLRAMEIPIYKAKLKGSETEEITGFLIPIRKYLGNGTYDTQQKRDCLIVANEITMPNSAYRGNYLIDQSTLEVCGGVKFDTGEGQLTIPDVSGLLLFSEREKKDLKLLLDYFGRNDVSTFEHFAFGFIKGLLKRLEQ